MMKKKQQAMGDEEIRGLAEKHWEWLKRLFKTAGLEYDSLHEFLFIEGGIHMVKHYRDDLYEKIKDSNKEK